MFDSSRLHPWLTWMMSPPEPLRRHTEADAGGAANPATASHDRWAWADNVRTAVILLVVNLHCCVTYSYVGGWYLNDGPERTLTGKLPFILWVFHLQAFFMGLLFFLAGIFADGAVNRRGPGSFLRERLFRLGLPALLYMVFIQPWIVYGLLPDSPPLPGDLSTVALYLRYLTTTRVLRGNGPMWFALALLFFSACLAAWRTFLRADGSRVSRPAPGGGQLLMFAAGLALATGITRVFFPIETNFYNFQLCYFPQYIAAFVAGLAASRGSWVRELVASRRARVAGWLGLLGGPPAFLALVILGGTPGEHAVKLYFGGWNPQAFGLAAWEQFTGLGLALGMMAWFYRSFNQAGPVARWLSSRSFAVYVLHPPILVILTLWFHAIPIGPFLHVVLLTLTGLAVSYGAADVAKRIPGVRRIL